MSERTPKIASLSVWNRLLKAEADLDRAVKRGNALRAALLRAADEFYKDGRYSERNRALAAVDEYNAALPDPERETPPGYCPECGAPEVLKHRLGCSLDPARKR